MIPALVLQQIAYAIAEECTPQQILAFLDEAPEFARDVLDALWNPVRWCWPAAG